MIKKNVLDKYIYLGQHAVVLNLTLSQCGSVVGNDDQLGFSLSNGFESTSVTNGKLSALHDKGQPGVDGLHRLLGLLAGNHLSDLMLMMKFMFNSR